MPEMHRERRGDVDVPSLSQEDGSEPLRFADTTDVRQAMADETGPNQPITITLEQWRWEQILQCLDRYVSWLRGDYSDMEAISDDAEWADELGWMTDDLRDIVNAGGTLSAGIGGKD